MITLSDDENDGKPNKLSLSGPLIFAQIMPIENSKMLNKMGQPKDSIFFSDDENDGKPNKLSLSGPLIFAQIMPIENSKMSNNLNIDDIDEQFLFVKDNPMQGNLSLIIFFFRILSMYSSPALIWVFFSSCYQHQLVGRQDCLVCLETS